MSDAVLSVGDTLTAKTQVLPVYKKSPSYSLSSSDVNVATIDGGSVTAVSNGTATVTLTTTDGDFTDTMGVTVKDIEYDISSTRTATGITIARKTDTIEIGEDYVAQAYVLSTVTEDHPYSYGYSDDNLVTWESSNPSVCRVKNGVLHAESLGTATITAYDLAKTVSESFTVTVIPETSLSYTDNEVLTLTASDIDTTDAETTTVAFQTILADASDNGYKKIVFPTSVYYISPAYGTIYIPTQMIIDFNGSTIQIEPSDLTTNGGYRMFQFVDTEYSSIINATIYGERYLIQTAGSESCEAIAFDGYNYRSGVKDCTISNSPGFNIHMSYGRKMITPFKLTSLEEGGIDDSGNNIETQYCFRCNGYIGITSANDKVGFGNMQGYQGYLYLSARCYDIFFYDTNYTFISCLRNCVQYYQYDKPSNAKYCRISFYQYTAPTSSDPDYHGIAHVFSITHQDHCYIKNCVMENNYSTAIAPEGGVDWLFDNCTFANNGIRDPSSHIDWEDGRLHLKGHVVRGCSFRNGGFILSTHSDGLTIYNCSFEQCIISMGSETQNERIWLNQFDRASCQISPKTDGVFSQNIGINGSSYTINTVDNVSFAIRQSENSFT